MTIQRITLALITLTTLVGCIREEKDFSKEATPDSIHFHGHVTTTGNEPLNKVKVTFDFVESRWLSGYTTRHKAECRTDKSGAYRFFFDSSDDERIRDSDMAINRAYRLNVDLEGLSSNDFIKPIDFNENKDIEKWVVHYGNDIPRGETFEKNFFIPRKRIVDVTVKSSADPHGSDDKFMICNIFRYGDGNLELQIPVDLKQGVDCVFQIPCAIGTENKLVLRCLDGGYGSYRDVSAVVAVDVTASSPEKIELSRNLIPEINRFKLSQHFDGPLAMPFSRVIYRLTDSNGKWQPDNNSFCQFYDSIVWSSSRHPKSITVFRRRGLPLVYDDFYEPQCETYFCMNENVVTRMQGFRKGRVVYTDSIKTTLYPGDFLCYDWATTDISLTGGQFTAVCALDPMNSYTVTHPQETSGHLYVKVMLEKRENEIPDNFLARSQFTLIKLMDGYFGSYRSISREEADKMFYRVGENETPRYLWQSSKTNVVLMKVDGDEGAYCYLLAERRN